MIHYEPELMFAFDSLNEYSDLKNVYNVTGDGVYYCPICLGRVKLWNGQNPNKAYKKQRCFHHIDGLCSHENRIHFAYKTWLLEPHSQFIVGDHIYEVENIKLESTISTAYGIYRPDMIIQTTDGKVFYAEIANTNKKTDDYILKWDELSQDVIEIDVNEQLSRYIINNTLPVFNIIYSSENGKCYNKHYVNKDYENIISTRKAYWKYKDVLNCKIKWEKLDWFWKDLQYYYNHKKSLTDVCESFSVLDFKDQEFICSCFKSGKHKMLRDTLENYYNDEQALQDVKLKRISNVIRKLNKAFGYSSSYRKPYLSKKNNWIIFWDSLNWDSSTKMKFDENTSPDAIFNFFHPIMNKYYLEKKEEDELRVAEKARTETELKRIHSTYDYILLELCEMINNSKGGSWIATYSFSSINYCIHIILCTKFETYLTIPIEEIDNAYDAYALIKKNITNAMNDLLNDAKNYSYLRRDTRILEVI